MDIGKLKAYLEALEKQAVQLSGAVLAVTQLMQLAEQETAALASEVKDKADNARRNTFTDPDPPKVKD